MQTPKRKTGGSKTGGSKTGGSKTGGSKTSTASKAPRTSTAPGGRAASGKSSSKKTPNRRAVGKKRGRSANRLKVRPIRLRDIRAIQELQRRCFPTLSPWTPEQIAAQVERFGEGQICVVLDGKLVATSSSLILHHERMSHPHTFEQICDRGMIGNHDPDGDILYGIDIAVDPAYRGQRLAKRLYDARKELTRRLNLRGMAIAGRIPNLHKQPESMSAITYVEKVLNKELRDHVLMAQISNGFVIRAILPGYLPSDTESRGNAVLMEWPNPSYIPRHGPRLPPRTARVAAVQYQMRTVSSFEEFATQCEFFIDTAGDYHCDFLLFPELLTNQILNLVPAERPALNARRLTEFTDQYIEFFTTMAMQYDINIIGGTHLSLEEDTLYNVAYLFRRDGSVDKQYKLHITPAEAHWWGVTPGDNLRIFDTDRGKIAILICYDIEFPELARVARGNGANILFVPFNTDVRSAYLRVRSCAQARCIENHVYTVMSGAVGNLPQVEGADIHYAHSCVLTPSDISFARDGIAEEGTPNVEAMVMHDLDLEVLTRTLTTGSVRPWVDRRTDLYQIRHTLSGDEASV